MVLIISAFVMDFNVYLVYSCISCTFVNRWTLIYAYSLTPSTPSSVTWLWHSSSRARVGLQLQTPATIPLYTTLRPPPWYCRELLLCSSRLLATWWQDTQGCCRVSPSRSRPQVQTMHIPAPPQAPLLFLGPHWTSSYSSNTPTSSSLSSR